MKAIQVKNLVKKYNKAEENAVDGVSFEVASGEFFTLLGPNGAGKTTTISILTTTLNKTSGELQVAGFDPDSQASQVRENVGIIFQKPSLDENLTAEENIRLHTMLYGMYEFRPTFGLMPVEYKKRVWELADLLEIKSDLNKPIKSFSGGMKRKLEIVRSLMHEPKILFLDEPTTGLDPQSRKNLWEYLMKTKEETHMTIFLTTHYLEEAEEADKVCIINQGKVLYMGTPEDIKDQLVEKYVMLDAKNRDKLKQELKQLKIKFQEIEPEHNRGKFMIKLKKQQTGQEIINKIKTKLSVLRVHHPSLERAYLEIINNNLNGSK